MTYDLNGNLTSDGSNTYVWNARNQLSSIFGSVTASFQYDAFGRRINKTVMGAATTFLYDGSNAVQELSGTTPTANMITGELDEVFSRADASGTWGPLLEGVGSTIALTDSTGTLQTHYTYEPFGNTTVGGAANGNSSQYTGRENDGTGLYYYRARYYSPSLERFLSEDRIGMAGGINLYAYVDNNPITYRDPFGLDKQKLDDVQKLRQALRDGVAEMNNRGMRNPGSGWLSGAYNNLVSYGAGYKGCREQAAYLEGRLHGTPYTPYQDNWTFEVKPTPFSFFPLHYYVEARSDNPRNPIIILDPWANKFRCRCMNQ